MSLATAFLRPISDEDQFGEAVKRATAIAEGFDRAYGTSWNRRSMNVLAGRGTIAELVSLAAPVGG